MFLYMGEIIQFNQLTTSLKSMESINSDERYFEGLLTVEMKDKQGEITIVDELYKVLPIWMDRGAPISDTHSNRIIGKGINYSKTVVKNEDGEDLAAIKITGKIFKNYELDNVIWNKIKSKEYQGLSFGGATRSNRTPMKMKDGSMAYALSNLEHYEVAVCKDPAVPMAVITDYNPIAKATFNTDMRDDGKMIIRCTQMGCFVEKSDRSDKWDRREEELGSQGARLNDDKPKDDGKPKGKYDYHEGFGDKNLFGKADDVNKDSLIKIEDEDDKNTEVEVLDEWKNDDNDNDEKEKDMTYRKTRGNVEMKYPTEGEEVWDSKQQKRVKETETPKRTGQLDDKIAADLNESQTFEQKVQALIKEGKSRESAEKIVGSFVHKTTTNQEQNVGVRAEQPYAAARTPAEIREAARNAKLKITLDADMKKAGYQTEAGNDQLGGQGATEDDKDKREKEDEEKENDELKRRDHSDSGGDIHSMYNQNVGREASSGRKTKAKGAYCPSCGMGKKDLPDTTTMGGACPNCGHGFKPKDKADTTANQVGGIRGGNDVAIQGSGETNDINIVQPRPERFEDKGAANIKIAIYTKKVKSINYALEKHAQIQELKKINDDLGDARGCTEHQHQ